MDNHFHLLILSPDEDIDRVMYFFMKRVTLQIQKDSGRINKVFGGRYKGCLIRDESYLFNVYKYIYRNPVKAGLCMRIEEYPFTTWNNELLETQTLFFSERKTDGELSWLNRDFRNDQSEGIRRSLKRTQFVPSQKWNIEKIIWSL
jgi:putative transposase